MWQTHQAGHFGCGGPCQLSCLLCPLLKNSRSKIFFCVIEYSSCVNIVNERLNYEHDHSWESDGVGSN